MAAESIPTYKLAGSGDSVSLLGLGTFAAEKENDDSVYKSVLEALRLGYRHIDTAETYGCEDQVGQAVRDSGLARSEIFVTSKLWNNYHSPEGVHRAMALTLKNTGLDYVDMFLMHYPIACVPDPQDASQEARDADGKLVIDMELSTNHVPTWRAMEELVRSGKARNIGVSNFHTGMLKALVPHAKVPVSCNQVECHPWLQQSELREYCRQNDILLVAYSPLGAQGDKLATPDTDKRLMDEPVVKQVAARNGITPGMVLLSWGIGKGHAVIPKSSNPDRIRQNMEGAAFTLPRADFDEITRIGESGQYHLVNFVAYFNGFDLYGTDRQYP